MKEQQFELSINNQPLKIKINNWAEQANGSVMVQYGDTVILATCVISDRQREGIDFLPLSVEYEEKFYAAGKISGSRYLRREGRPSNEAVINARLIDRVIRPLFLQSIRNEIQVVITCLSWDGENDPDVLGLIGASLALAISDIPWNGPFGAMRITQKNGVFGLNSTYKEREDAGLDLLLTGVERNGDILINMAEGQANEVGEDVVNEALNQIIPWLKDLVSFQKKIVEEIGKQKMVIDLPFSDQSMKAEIQKILDLKLEKALYQKDKKARAEALHNIKQDLIFYTEEKYPGEKKVGYALEILEKNIDDIIHKNILESEKRVDGRKIDEVRKIDGDTGVLPRTHGSGLFSRGSTRSLSTLTLGPPGDHLLLEGMEVAGKKSFMHHYNFPPYSTGEVKPMRGPGRRELGHGTLAEKALLPLIPDSVQFPYTIRIVSEILSSNGSSSMASISSSSLALMDAGVPIKRLATGIAIGMARDNNNYKILTDIQGPEDHYGDMDLKIAGTREGITAIQMDVKIDGIDLKMFEEALQRAKKAREQILDSMEKIISKPRPDLSPFAPRISTLQINPEKIRDVIGPGGKMIHAITDECEVEIDVDDSGKVFVTSVSKEGLEKATRWIKDITREIKVDEIFQGKVTRILNFGAMTEILPNKEGLIHISKLAPGRVEKVEDIVNEGDVVSVKVLSIDKQGRIDLSLLKVLKKN